MEIFWGSGSGFNLGRVGETGIRVERFNVAKKGEVPARWRFLLADDSRTYMHCDEREFATVAALEDAAIRWLIDAGRLNYLH